MYGTEKTHQKSSRGRKERLIESIFAELGFTQLKLEIKEQEIRSRIVVARFI